MERWAHQKNLERFERDLTAETDIGKRKLLQGLIDRERSRLTQLGSAPTLK